MPANPRLPDDRDSLPPARSSNDGLEHRHAFRLAGSQLRRRPGVRPKGVRSFWRSVVSLACLHLATGAFYGVPGLGQALAPVPGSQLHQLTPQPGFFNEPSVAINPANPQQIAVAYQINASVATSQDGGGSWQIVPDTAPKDYRVSGDVSTTYDRAGHLFLCAIAFDKLGTAQYWGHNATRNEIFVRRSLDGGKTWEANTIPVDQKPSTPGIPFEDKPYIVADTTSGRFSGNLYIGWTQWDLAQSLILFSRSTDAGASWSKPMRISTHAGLPRDDNGAVEGFSGVVSPDGTVNVVWADGPNLVFARSRDGGKSFGRSHPVMPVAPTMFDVEGVARANGFPVIAANEKGELFLAWSDYRNGDVDVWCAHSSNHGKSWSDAVRVNSEPIHSGTDQFFPWMTVDQKTGDVYVVFYDRRQDPANEKMMVTLARSTDGGKSFTNYAWTSNAFAAQGDFLGDYTGLAADGGHVVGAWAEEQAKPPAVEVKKEGGEEDAAPPKTKRETVVRVGVAQFP